MKTYALGIANSVTGPYRARASQFKAGALDFYRGSHHLYRRGMHVGGVKSGIVNFIIDIVHILLVLGGAYLVATAIFA